MQTTSTQDGTNQESPKSDDTSSTKNVTMFDLEKIKQFFVDNVAKVSSETIGWLAVVFMHAATIPSILALIFGISDRLPSIDVVAFLWTGLLLLFVRALINRDMLNIITIGVGFIIQAGLLGFLVFK